MTRECQRNATHDSVRTRVRDSVSWIRRSIKSWLNEFLNLYAYKREIAYDARKPSLKCRQRRGEREGVAVSGGGNTPGRKLLKTRGEGPWVQSLRRDKIAKLRGNLESRARHLVKPIILFLCNFMLIISCGLSWVTRKSIRSVASPNWDESELNRIDRSILKKTRMTYIWCRRHVVRRSRTMRSCIVGYARAVVIVSFIFEVAEVAIVWWFRLKY